MHRLMVMLAAVVLGSATPGGVLAGGDRANAHSITQLILVFFSDVSRVLSPKRVVAEGKDWKIVKDAEQQQNARRSREELRREAYQRLQEQEREARTAREEYRRETRNMLYERHFGWRQQAEEREARKAQEERLRAAERRVHEQEWEAQQAKEQYLHAARMAREERRREAEKARAGG